MAPPAYKDLFKAVAKSFFKDDFDTNIQATFKTKTAQGVGAEISAKQAGKGVEGKLKGKYTFAGPGITVEDSWSSNNQITTDVSFKPSFLQGSKVSAEVKINPFDGAKLESLSTSSSLQGDAFHINGKLGVVGETDLTVAGVVNAGIVDVGAQATYSREQGAICCYEAAVNHSVEDFTAGAKVAGGGEGFDVTGYLFFPKAAPFELGAQVGWSTGSDKKSFAVGGRYAVDDTTSIKSKLDLSGKANISYSQQLRPEFKVVLTSQLNLFDLKSDAHQFGAAFTFDG